MATISVSSGSYVRPYRKSRIVHYPEDTSQTFKKGEPVILSTDSNEGNRLKISGSDPTAGLVGIAAEDASGTVLNKIPVWVFDEESEFVIHMATAQTLDNDDIGVQYGIVKDGTNVIWNLDNTETTAVVFRVVQLLDAHGDTQGRCIVRAVNAPRGPYKS